MSPAHTNAMEIKSAAAMSAPTKSAETVSADKLQRKFFLKPNPPPVDDIL